MESNPTTAATIAELWREFQKTLKHKPAMYISHAAHKGIEVTRYAKHISEAATKYTALRAQLIERCGVVNDADGRPILFEIFGSSNIEGKPSRQMNIETKVNGNWCNPHELREISACAAFWAWELDQLQKENENGK